MRILVADDNPVTRSTLEAVLKKLGHDAISAPDGEAAWRKYSENPCSVVITDWEMPEIDGLELCRRIRGKPSFDYVYIIVLTHRTGRQSVIDALSAGADDFMPKPCDPGELQARLAVAHRIIGLQSALRDAAGRLEKLAHLDPLMAVGNRLAFKDYVPELHAAADRSGRGYAVLLCDVDHFKTCNDRFGHAFGDEVLRRIAQGLTGAVRNTDRIFRYGGEEIVVIGSNTELAQALEVAERLRTKVSELEFSVEASDGPLRITISIGVCCYDPTLPRRSWEEITEYADQALYEAKHNGRDCVVAAVPQPDGSVCFRLTKPQIDYSYMKALFRD